MNDKKNILYLDFNNARGGSVVEVDYIVQLIDRQRFAPVLMIGVTSILRPVTLKNNKVYVYPCSYKYRVETAWERMTFRLKKTNAAVKCVLDYLFRAADLLFFQLPLMVFTYVVIKKERIAIVHQNNGIYGGAAGIVASKIAGSKCVCHIWETPQRLSRFERWLVRFIDKLIIETDTNRERLLAFGVAPEKVHRIYSGVDMSRYDYRRTGETFKREIFKGNVVDSKLIGMISRLAAGKGIEFFIDAANAVRTKYPAAKFIIVGSAAKDQKAYFTSLCERAKNQSLEDSIIFTGWRDDIPDILAGLDVVVNPSTLSEGMGVAIAEAMAMKKPLVVSAVGGSVECVDNGRAAILVEGGRSDQIADAVVMLLRDQEKTAQLSDNARALAEERYDMHKNIRQLEAVYRSLC